MQNIQNADQAPVNHHYNGIKIGERTVYAPPKQLILDDVVYRMDSNAPLPVENVPLNREDYADWSKDELLERLEELRESIPPLMKKESTLSNLSMMKLDDQNFLKKEELKYANSERMLNREKLHIEESLKKHQEHIEKLRVEEVDISNSIEEKTRNIELLRQELQKEENELELYHQFLAGNREWTSKVEEAKVKSEAELAKVKKKLQVPEEIRKMVGAIATFRTRLHEVRSVHSSKIKARRMEANFIQQIEEERLAQECQAAEVVPVEAAQESIQQGVFDEQPTGRLESFDLHPYMTRSAVRRAAEAEARQKAEREAEAAAQREADAAAQREAYAAQQQAAGRQNPCFYCSKEMGVNITPGSLCLECEDALLPPYQCYEEEDAAAGTRCPGCNGEPSAPPPPLNRGPM